MPPSWLLKDGKDFLRKWKKEVLLASLQEHKEKPENFTTGILRGINEFIYVSYFGFQKSRVQDKDLESGSLLGK